MNEEEVVNVAAETMLGDLMSLCVNELKAAPDVWQKMSEDTQSDVIQRVEDQCRAAVDKATLIIAAGGIAGSVVATVDSVTFKDGIKVVLKCPSADQGAHALADCQGDNVLVVISDSDQFSNTSSAPQAEADQRGLDLDADGDKEMFSQDIGAALEEAFGGDADGLAEQPDDIPEDLTNEDEDDGPLAA